MYAGLSVMPWNPSPGGNHLGSLCEALWSARDGPLREERILSSLLRPQCDALVAAYCTTALRLQRDQLLTSSPQLQGRRPSPSSWRTCKGKILAPYGLDTLRPDVCGQAALACVFPYRVIFYPSEGVLIFPTSAFVWLKPVSCDWQLLFSAKVLLTAAQSFCIEQILRCIEHRH